MANQTINLSHTKWIISQADSTSRYNFTYWSGYGTYADLSRANGSARQAVFQLTGTLDNAYKYNKLVSAKIVIPGISPVGDATRLNSWVALRYVDGVATTWAIKESLTSTYLGLSYGSSSLSIPNQIQSDEYFTAETESEAAYRLLTCGSFFLYPASANLEQIRLWSTLAGVDSKFRVIVDDAVTITSKVAGADKMSGYVNPHISQTFSWTFERDSNYYCVGSWTQASATFKWRVGTSGAWTTVSASGSTQSVTLSANTLTAGETIQWCVTATDNEGTTTTSSVYTISTAAAAMVSTPVSPIDVIIDNGATTKFTWTSVASDGQAQSAAQLQYSTDGVTWTSLGSVSTSAKYKNIAGGTLPTGTIYWRVRGANVDGTYGAWSSAVSFVSYGAPLTPTVSATAKSFTTVSWQASSQEAYKVTIDGVVYGPFFGDEKEFSPDEYLADGNHTIAVQVQNSFGLWSDAGIITITISTPVGYAKPQITASKFNVDGRIEWSISNAGSTTAVFIYRDNVRIAKVPFSGGSGVYIDTHVLGEHSYKVVQRYYDYALISTIASGAMKSCITRIAALAGGSWLELELSDNSNRTEEFSYSRTTVLRHFSGSEWPVAEIGVAKDEYATYDTSFAKLSEANAFEALRGQAVIIKSRGGQVMVGVLSDLQKSMTEFYIRFQFNIQRIHWEDYVDETS